MEKSYRSFNGSSIGVLILSLAFVISFSLQALIPVPSDVWTLMEHEVYQYYTRPTQAGPYAEEVVDFQLQGQWQPHLYRLGSQLQYDSLWCLQVEVTMLKNNAQIKESTDWIALKPLHRPWQLFPVEPASAAPIWKQHCGRQSGK